MVSLSNSYLVIIKKMYGYMADVSRITIDHLAIKSGLKDILKNKLKCERKPT